MILPFTVSRVFIQNRSVSWVLSTLYIYIYCQHLHCIYVDFVDVYILVLSTEFTQISYSATCQILDQID